MEYAVHQRVLIPESLDVLSSATEVEEMVNIRGLRWGTLWGSCKVIGRWLKQNLGSLISEIINFGSTVKGLK